jgi:hypothetical protein
MLSPKSTANMITGMNGGTGVGLDAAGRGFPVYVEAVQRLFQDFVTDEEAEVLVRIWNRVLEGNDMACGPVSEAAAALPQRA